MVHKSYSLGFGSFPNKKEITKERIVEELRSIIFDYQETMTKDTEQSLKNLIDAIELDSPMLIEKENK